jgi:sugar transferase (PEP-CTERM system associated)
MLRILKQYFPIRNIVFVILEGCIIFSSIVLASVILTFFLSYSVDMFLIFRITLVTLIIQICLYYNDLYDFSIASSIPEMGIRLLQGLGAASIILALVYFLFPVTIIDQRIFGLSLVLLIFFITGWRMAYLQVLNKGWFNKGIMILGSGGLAVDICNEISANIDCGYSVRVLIPDTRHSPSFEKELPGVMANPESNLLNQAEKFKIQKVVVALSEMRNRFPVDQLLQCRTAGIEVLDGSSFYEQLTGKVLVEKINPSWLIFSEGFKKSRLRIFLKRMEDIVLGTVLLVILFPLLILVALVIKLDSKGPLFFVQQRVGQHKKEYRMRKFRSMVEDAEKLSGPVWAEDNDPRITGVGKIIRQLRIDELPQLWEVITGKMSLVGPRPERRHFTDMLEKQIPFYAQRFNVKPGITGWAQVSYDYGATVEDAVEKLNYELFYIKNMSLFLDIIIILRTIKTVIFGRGAR